MLSSSDVRLPAGGDGLIQISAYLDPPSTLDETLNTLTFWDHTPPISGYLEGPGTGRNFESMFESTLAGSDAILVSGLPVCTSSHGTNVCLIAQTGFPECAHNT